jgi:hypothetical protein
MFEKVGDHIVRLDDWAAYNPQNISNIVWAYAKVDAKHPALFKLVGDSIVGFGASKQFIPQDLANIVWSYANAGEEHPELFKIIGHSIAAVNDLAIFDAQALATIAWAYALADIDAPFLFNERFAKALLDRQQQFNIANLTQLYQWHLWQTKEFSHAGLPEELRVQCYQAFVMDDSLVSRLHKDVAHELISMDLKPVEEFLAPSGYSIDSLIGVNSRRIGIEVDGPFHFVDRKPTARTLLKRRQITAIDKIQLVSVPYWEWDKLGNDHAKKQKYLRTLLGLNG